ncbi:MAG TPA: hypothetical protein VGV07_06370 [Devosia sp.]|jgi:hypothetical protein|uniref:hypothetical protein n=1 Tax=Devosia sp. TaxID=1871048 RepID=UPI002DDDAF05|nr:hypothetical protein [Devosia sp.]HEV2514854.1 hypothetical protein [Devosia sp.]
MSTALATIIHDTEGRLAEPIRDAAPALRRMFSEFAASLTEATDPQVATALTEALGARVSRHPTGEAIIGLARRNAVALALEGDAARVLYSDMDHVLRWIDADPAEMLAVLSSEPEAQLLIIGRTAEAMAAVPRRLRDTEAPVNRAYELLTGRAADLLFAVRRIDRATARDIVAHSRVDSIANDVEWPLLAEQLGRRVGYAQAHGLKYRTIDEYGAAADSYDHDPLQWIRRLEMAGDMARAMRPYLKSS